MDVLTVNFIVWQFIYLMCKWKNLELKWPFLIFQLSIMFYFLYYYEISFS